MKKICNGHFMSPFNTDDKTFRIMRLTFIALFVFSFSLLASVHSQTMRVNINANNESTHSILEQIEQQTDYLFIYNTNEIDLNRKASVHAQDQTVMDVLSQIFRNTNIGYAIEGSNIMLMKKDEKAEQQQDNNKVSGTITDKSGEPIIGANVVIKGTTNGTITDIDGNYTLDVPVSAILQISYIGYLTQDVPVNGKQQINIRLVEDTQQLDEVVVVGYGTQKKGELTSSISSIKSETFIQGSVQDAAQLLQGKVAGLGIVMPNGDPTSSSQIVLRGIGSLKGDRVPLVIVDGVPGDMSTVAPEDIESIDVIKDGSAAAIYGTRGNNGVIFITTKKVKGEIPVTIDIQAYVTTQQIKKRLDMMDADQYRQLVKQGKPGAIDYGYDTDWLDQILRTPISYVTNASLRGGNRNSNYIANINYKSGQGIIKRSDNYDLVGSPWGAGAYKGIPQFIDTYDPDDERLNATWLGGPQYASDGTPLTGSYDLMGQPLIFVNKMPNGIFTGEAEGYRWLKYEVEMGARSELNNDLVLFRLTQVHMMKAECLLRTGKADQAASIVSMVRKRAFKEHPEKAIVSGAQLQEKSCYKYGTVENYVLTSQNQVYPEKFGRFYDELGWEFAGESYRRRDMIRFGHFTKAKWLSHEPNGDYKTVFPLPQKVVDTNPNLEQNPNYQ